MKNFFFAPIIKVKRKKEQGKNPGTILLVVKVLVVKIITNFEYCNEDN
jgi:hypothetical protein